MQQPVAQLGVNAVASISASQTDPRAYNADAFDETAHVSLSDVGAYWDIGIDESAGFVVRNDLPSIGQFTSTATFDFSGHYDCSAPCDPVPSPEASPFWQTMLTFYIDTPYSFSLTTEVQRDGLGSTDSAQVFAQLTEVAMSGEPPIVDGASYLSRILSRDDPSTALIEGTLRPGMYLLMTTGQMHAYGSHGEFASHASFANSLTMTPVPLPAAGWLLLSGLGGVATFARRRKIAPRIHSA